MKKDLPSARMVSSLGYAIHRRFFTLFSLRSPRLFPSDMPGSHLPLLHHLSQDPVNLRCGSRALTNAPVGSTEIRFARAH